MKTFIWNYGKEQLSFKEEFDEHKNWADTFKNIEFSSFEENFSEDVYESENSLKQPSEYLFDVHLLKLMKNTISKSEYNIANKDMHLGYDIAQKFLAYNKGLLAEIDKSMNSESNDIDLCEYIYRFINACRTTWQNDKSFDEIREEFSVLFDENSQYNDEIIAIEKYFRDDNHLRQPYYLYEKLVKKISPLIRERRQLIRMIKYISPYRLRAYNREPLTCQMVLHDEFYSDFIKEADDLIVSDATKTINDYLASTSIDEADFRNSVNHMIDCINSCDKGGYHNFGYFRSNKRGCFCVFDINTDEYISLSGPFDVTDPVIEAYFGYDQNKKRSNKALMTKINSIILADSVLQNSKYAGLNLLTKRYPYTNGPSIPSNGETVEDAIKRKIDKNEIQGGYSCCERKIFSFISDTDLGQCYMFVKHKPCQRCIPAIKKFLQNPGRIMRIFYYDNDSVKEFDMSTI